MADITALNPSSAEFKEEREVRRLAAEQWIRDNVQVALVVPRDKARDLFASGYGQAEWAKVLPTIMPGEKVEAVEVSPNFTFVILARQ